MPPQKKVDEGQATFHAARTPPFGPLTFVSPEVVCYVVGNSICLRNTDSGQQDYIHTTVYSITKLCGNPAKGLLAFCEGGTSPQVFVYAVDPKPKLLFTLSDVTELELADLCFSACGSRLYTLSKAMSKRLMVFSTERGIKLKGCELELPMRFDKICVYPGHKDHIALVRTSSIRMVTLQKSFETYIAKLHPAALPADVDVSISAYAWTLSGHFLFATRQGALCTMDGRTGALLHACQVAQPIVSIAVTSKSIVTAHSGNSVRFWSHDAKPLTDGPSVNSLTSAPPIEDSAEVYELQTALDLEAEAQMRRPENFPAGQITHLQVKPAGAGAVLMTAEGEIWTFELPLSPIIPGFDDEGDADIKQNFSVDDMKLSLLTWFHTHAVSDLVFLGHSGRICASADEGGRLHIWQITRGSDPKGFRTIRFTSPIAGLCPDDSGQLLVVGTDAGCVHLVSCDKWANSQVIETLRLSTVGISKLCSITVANRCLCVAATMLNHKIAIIVVPLESPRLTMLGFTDVGGAVEDLCFQKLANPGDMTALKLLVVGNSHDRSSGCLWAVGAPPLDHDPIAADLKRDMCQLWTTKVSPGTDMSEKPTAVASVTPESVVVGFANGRLRIYSTPQAQQSPSGGLAVTDSEKELAQHQQLITIVHTFGNGPEFLVSASMDGAIRQTDLKTGSQTMQRTLHSPYNGGVAQVRSGSDSKLWASTGGSDGIIVWGTAESSWRPSPEDSTLDEEMPPISAEIDDKNLEAFPIWAPLSAEEKAALSETVDDPEVTAAAVAHRKALMLEVDAIRKKLNVLIEDNRNCPELEMLERSEFCVDNEEAARIAATTQERCNVLRAKIEKENLARQLIRDRLIKEFWDPTSVKGCMICSLQPDSNLSVANYPSRKESDEEKAIVQKLRNMRKVEQLEATTLLSAQCPAGLKEDIMIQSDPFTSRQEQYIVNWWPSDTEGDGSQENAKLLYEPFQLLTNCRRRLQIFLLQSLASDFRIAFNKLFEQCQGDKKSTMDQIKEKTTRIKQILGELQIDEEVPEPALQDCEEVQAVLEVKDSEISVEKWISPEERQRIAEAEAKEEERLRQLRENDAGQRALNQMMGGTLKTKKDLSALEITLDKEAWMDEIAEEDMTEVQLAALKEFREKEKALAEEQDKYRKQLDAELKRLRQEVMECMQQFETVLKELHHKRFSHDSKVFCQELYCIRLHLALLQSVEDNKDVARIEKEIEEAMQRLGTHESSLEAFQDRVSATKDEQDDRVRTEKEVTSAQYFRQQYAQSGLEPEQIATLLQLFRKRNRRSTVVHQPSSLIGTETRGMDSAGLTSMDPRRTRAGMSITMEKGLEGYDPDHIKDAYPDLGTDAAEPSFNRSVSQEDDPVDPCPEGVDEASYKRMLELRRQRDAMEKEVQKGKEILEEMYGLLSHLDEERNESQGKHESLEGELQEQLQLMEKELFDIELFFKLKQGQVEVPQAAVVTDYSDAIVIHQEVVESRNRRIQELGKQKVGILEITKEFRKQLNHIQWEHRVLALQTTDLEERTKDVHMLRVTKELQSLLKGGEEGKNKADADLLERKIEHLKTTVESKETTLKKQYGMVAQSTKLRKAENAMLEKKLRELQQNVIQREHIRRLRAPQGGDAGPGKDGGKPRIIGGGGRIQENVAAIRQAQGNFKEVKTRQSLMEAVKKHTEEIDLLRKELDRLRQKSFPSFIQLNEDRPANPDHISR